MFNSEFVTTKKYHQLIFLELSSINYQLSLHNFVYDFFGGQVNIQTS